MYKYILTLKDIQNAFSEKSKLPINTYSIIHFCTSKFYKEHYVHNEALLQQFILRQKNETIVFSIKIVD